MLGIIELKKLDVLIPLNASFHEYDNVFKDTDLLSIIWMYWLNNETFIIEYNAAIIKPIEAIRNP